MIQDEQNQVIQDLMLQHCNFLIINEDTTWSISAKENGKAFSIYI